LTKPVLPIELDQLLREVAAQAAVPTHKN
jgi:hypothetical protein